MSETDTHEVSKRQSGDVFLIKLGVEIAYVILQCTEYWGIRGLFIMENNGQE